MSKAGDMPCMLYWSPEDHRDLEHLNLGEAQRLAFYATYATWVLLRMQAVCQPDRG